MNDPNATFDLSVQQEQHIKEIISTFSGKMVMKYRKGAQEHGGELLDKDLVWLLDNALDEAIDQVVYLITARTKAIKLMAYLQSLD